MASPSSKRGQGDEVDAVLQHIHHLMMLLVEEAPDGNGQVKLKLSPTEMY